MLIGRFGIMIPALALGGVLAAKNVVPASLGTFRTDNGMFVGLTIGVIVIIGGLTFFPAVVSRPDRRAAQPRKVLLMTTPMTSTHARRRASRPRRPQWPTGWPRPGASSTARSCARP